VAVSSAIEDIDFSRGAHVTNENAVKLAVLIDADNAQPSIVEALLAEIAKYGTAHVKRAYGDWTGPNLKGWKDQLLAQSIQPIQQFAYTHRKNSTDSAMIIDAMDLLYAERFDGFCIVSSDSDFTRLASRIRESGLIVYGFGERKTPKAFVSACDKFVYVENLQEPLEQPEPEPTRVPAALLNKLRNAVEAGSDDDGWAMLSHVGQILTKQSPDFDSRTYGFGKLSDLITSIKLFDVDRRDAGSGKHAVIYVRDRRRRTEK
jgi:Fe-S-cluster formation regulator IscX/YfhJ